jgi:predicted amidohydrolase YtcJ
LASPVVAAQNRTCGWALTPGRLADLTVWDQDPAQCTGDALRDLRRTHTFVGGLLVTPTGTR